MLGDYGFAVQLALIWLAHIGADRLLGYGLKYPTAFTDTWRRSCTPPHLLRGGSSHLASRTDRWWWSPDFSVLMERVARTENAAPLVVRRSLRRWRPLPSHLS